MRTLIILGFILLAVKGYAQHNLYTFNNGFFIEQNNLNLKLNTARKTLPPTHQITVVIYHKFIKNDTVINYINFSVSKKSAAKDSKELEFIYRPDSTFLLLNKKLPAFKLKDLRGNEIASAQLLGKPTMINFWATYCGPCIVEMPELSKLKKKYGDRMNFIAITENNNEKDKLTEFLKDKNFNFLVLTDAENYKKELKIKALPKSLFVDRSGILQNIQDGYPININDNSSAQDDGFTKIIEKLIENSNNNH